MYALSFKKVSRQSVTHVNKRRISHTHRMLYVVKCMSRLTAETRRQCRRSYIFLKAVEALPDFGGTISVLSSYSRKSCSATIINMPLYIANPQFKLNQRCLLPAYFRSCCYFGVISVNLLSTMDCSWV